MKVTWTEGNVPPSHERGLPSEIHFWSYGGNIWILRDTDTPDVPTWCRWNPGVAIKDVGSEYVSKQNRDS